VSSAYWAPLTAFSATLVTLWWLMHSRVALNVLDRPNERSLHQHPIPRVGGIGIHAGIALAWLMLAPDITPVSWNCLVVLLAVSCADDIWGVPVVLRLAVHLVTALALAYLLLGNLSCWWLAPVTALAITWMINLYNFMDGSDGLAGGMALFGFGSYGIAAWFFGDHEFALLNFSISAAAGAFLIFNFYPAKIFMGDVGSVPLGYLAGVLGLTGWVNGHWTWWFPLLVFSPFTVDASVTLARRLFQGERIWEAHRDHYYQRLVQLGWGHRNTALAEYVLMIVCGVAALAALRFPQTTPAMITMLALTYIVLTLLIMRAWSKMQEASKSCD
jgi:UDP-N-acetylmuramyl pentapeptide phosphotransferase/UDP-N-acetylglucosamine-1-phosphate transferase